MKQQGNQQKRRNSLWMGWVMGVLVVVWYVVSIFVVQH